MSHRPLSAWQAIRRAAAYRPGLFALCFAQLVAWNSTTLVTGLLLQHLFDALGGGASAGFGVHGIVAVLVAAEFARLALMWGGVVRTRAWENMRGLLRLNLLRAQMRSGGPEAGTSTTSPGELVSRFRDDVDDLLAFLDSAFHTAGKVVLAVSSLAIMVAIHPVITVAVGLPLFLVVVVTRMARARIRAYRTDYREASAAVTGFLGELFGSVLTVKAANADGGVLGRLADVNERRRRTGLRDQLVTKLLGGFNRATMDLSVGVVLLLAVPAMRRGDFTVGDLALFVSYLGNLVWLPYYAGQLIARHRQAGVSLDRMTALLPPGKPHALVTHRPLRDDEPPPPAAPHAALTHLTASGLTAVHPMSGRGVHDLSLALERGTFTVVTGPAGAGKTTLLRALLGLLPSQEGTVRWNGVLVEDRAEFMVPPRSAYVPQVPRLFSESLRDNLLLGLAETAALRSAVRTAVLDRDVAAMPRGLDTEVGARGVRLSGGQVQRAAIARALARRTDLLVLDDVSSALDVDTERRLWDRLRATTDRTLLVVSNRPATIARADQVICLDHGRSQPGSVRVAG
jgi:ATP-binding cassette subfamily B protein